MNTAEEVYKAALRELAAEGNEKAKFALSLGSKFGETATEIRPLICNALTAANESLLEALHQNGIEWTRSTDNHIRDAQQKIIAALTTLAKR